MPVAVLDLTAGHRGEEPGYGYLRPKYVFDHGALHSYYAGKDHAKKEEQVEAALQQMHELDAIVSSRAVEHPSQTAAAKERTPLAKMLGKPVVASQVQLHNQYTPKHPVGLAATPNAQGNVLILKRPSVATTEQHRASAESRGLFGTNADMVQVYPPVQSKKLLAGQHGKLNLSNNVFEEVGSLDATVPLASDTKLLSEGEGGIRESTTKLLEDENLRMIVETEGRLEATSRLSDLAKQATLRTTAMEALQGMGEHKPLAETLVEFNSSRKPENVE